jgi:hypothetical protein
VARYEALKEREPGPREGEEPADESEGILYRPPEGKRKPSREGREARDEAGEKIEPKLAPQTISIVGRTPLGLQEIGPEDEVHEVDIVVDERELPLSKGELMDLVAGLPKGTAVRLQIKVVQRD